MRKKLALLSLLMLMSVGAAVAASAVDAFPKGKAITEIEEVMIVTFLSPDEKAKAVEIALGNLQIQNMLEGADNYCTSVYEVFDLQKNERGIMIIAKQELALVELRIYKDYDEEFGVKVVKVTVDLLKEEVMEIEECPEVRKPKVLEGTISTDELLGSPSAYQGQVVRVSGTVSDLGLLRGPYFALDGKLFVCYHYFDESIPPKETNIYPTQIEGKIQNGDRVVVTGKFLGDILYAEKVEKVTS